MDSLIQLNDDNDESFFYHYLEVFIWLKHIISCSNFMYPIIRNKKQQQKGKQSSCKVSENTFVFISYRRRDLLLYGKALKSNLQLNLNRFCSLLSYNAFNKQTKTLG